MHYFFNPTPPPLELLATIVTVSIDIIFKNSIVNIVMISHYTYTLIIVYTTTYNTVVICIISIYLTNLCSIIMKVTSYHFCYILLVKNGSQVLPTLNQVKDKVWIPRERDYGDHLRVCPQWIVSFLCDAISGCIWLRYMMRERLIKVRLTEKWDVSFNLIIKIF